MLAFSTFWLRLPDGNLKPSLDALTYGIQLYNVSTLSYVVSQSIECKKPKQGVCKSFTAIFRGFKPPTELGGYFWASAGFDWCGARDI